MNTYLFDFDGTLVDSMPTYISAMLRILDENNIPYENDIIKIITPLGLIKTAEYFVNMGLDLEKDELISVMKQYMMEEYLYHIPAKNNVVDVLKKLKETGASINILTASPHITLDACLKRLCMYELFDNIWSCDDFNTTKSDPEIYKMVAKKLNKNINDILFLDDNLNAIETAKSSNLKVCGV